jgi:long-chain acyl-CoA synthetase
MAVEKAGEGSARDTSPLAQVQPAPTAGPVPVVAGMTLPPLVKPPITRDQLQRYAEASGDHNPIHLDDEAARRVGLDGVIAHGMLSMGFLGQYVTGWLASLGPGGFTRRLTVRFVRIVRPGDVLTCEGTVQAVARAAEGPVATLAVRVINQQGEAVTTGDAEVLLPPYLPEAVLPLTLPELAAQNLRRFGEYVSLVYEGREYTNVQRDREATRLAAGLARLGVGRGDRIIVMMPNSPEVLIAYQAIAKLGAITVPLLPLLKTPEVHYVAANCQATAILTSELLLPIVLPAITDLDHVRAVIATGELSSEIGDPRVRRYDETLAEPGVTLPEFAVQPEDTAVIIYTSGTTGRPKGVELTHRNLCLNALSGGRAHPSERREVWLAVLPLAHAFGITVANASFLSDSLTVMLPRFDPQAVLEAIQRYRVTSFSAVPAMLVALLNYPNVERYDVSSLEWVACGSAPLPVAVLEGFQRRFGCLVLEGYGLSEATTIVTAHRAGMPQKPGSVGVPIDGVEVRVVDASGHDVPVGEVGELIVRGPSVMRGYYNMPEATQETLRDGWLYTGDMARLDEDGYVYIVERKKDLIIRGGMNIFPRDVEEVLARHPAVLEAAVIGVPSERLGEEVKAFVVLRPGQQVSAEELIAFSREYLANYKTPRFIEFVPSLPRNAVGKVDKKVLRTLSAQP